MKLSPRVMAALPMKTPDPEDLTDTDSPVSLSSPFKLLALASFAGEGRH